MRNDSLIPSIHAILQSGNLFVYAINNPVRFVDASGLVIFDILEGIARFKMGVIETLTMGTLGAMDAVTDPIGTAQAIGAGIMGVIRDPMSLAVGGANYILDLYTAVGTGDWYRLGQLAAGPIVAYFSKGAIKAVSAGIRVAVSKLSSTYVGVSVQGIAKGMQARVTAAVNRMPRNVDISRLRPNPLDEFTNPRIGPSNTAMSHHLNYIRRHGRIESPIDVRVLADGNFEIINGHHRWYAAQRMGLERVPIRVIE
jgi:hypothetical protein